MTSDEINELKLSIQEAYAEVGANVAVKRRTNAIQGKADLYGQYNVPESYLSPEVACIGIMKLNPKARKKDDDEHRIEKYCSISIATQELEDAGLIANGVMTIKYDDVITVLGTDYDVENIVPVTQIGDACMAYKVECSLKVR